MFSEFIGRVLARAAEIARHHSGRVSAMVKAGDQNQVVTAADLEVGKQIIAAIQAAYPEHAILDEEAGAFDAVSDGTGAVFTWVVDPIDGTSNFAAGVPTYAIMLGLLRDNVPYAGGLALPAFGEIYVAERGHGAFLADYRLKVRDEPSLASVLVAYGLDGAADAPERTRLECAVLAEIALRARNVRISNSAFDVAMLLKGGYGAVLNQSTRIWDNVAQHVLVEEAGGLYTSFFGEPLDYSRPLTRGETTYSYCAAPPMLHAAVQRVIAAQR